MKDKNDNKVVIIYIIFVLIVYFAFGIYYKMKLTTLIGILVALFITMLIIYIPYRIRVKREELVNELFIIEIRNKSNNDERIRITEKNILFKYKGVINYYYIFPRILSSIFLRGKAWETVTYRIRGKTQLTVDEVNEIINEINKLNNNVDGDTILNYKGNKKLVDRNDIDKIIQKYLK